MLGPLKPSGKKLKRVNILWQRLRNVISAKMNKLMGEYKC